MARADAFEADPSPLSRLFVTFAPKFRTALQKSARNIAETYHSDQMRHQQACASVARLPVPPVSRAVRRTRVVRFRGRSIVAPRYS